MYCERFSNIFPCRLEALLMAKFSKQIFFFVFILCIPLINILGKLLSPSGSVYLLSLFPHLALGHTVLAV